MEDVLETLLVLACSTLGGFLGGALSYWLELKRKGDPRV